MTESMPRIDNLRRSFSFDNARTWLLFIAVIVLLGVIYMGQASQAALTGQRVNDKQEKLARIQQENAQLQAEIAVLLAPDRMEKRAKSLGFHLASADQIKYLAVKDYPLQPTQSALTQSAPPASASASAFDIVAWWNSLLARLGLSTSPRAAEAGD